MLQVKLNKIKEIVYEQIDQPGKIRDGEAVIKVHSVGICGSDMHVYLGKNPVLSPPKIQGHEFGGTIKSISKPIKPLKEGIKVVINPVVNCGSCYYCRSGIEYLCEKQSVIGGDLEGAMKEEIVVPTKNVVPLPDSFDLMYAPLIEPTSVAVHSVNGISNSNVVIIGLGTIGLLTQQVCKLNGNRVITIDVEDYPIKLSQKLGSDLTFNFKDADISGRIEEFLGGEKVDAVLDNVNSFATFKFAINVVKKHGKIVLVGIPPKNFEVNVIDLLCKEILVTGSYLYTDAEFRTAAQYAVKNKIKLEPLLTKYFPFEKAKEAYEYKMSTPSIKVTLVNYK